MNRLGKTLLILALVAVVGMAFRVSWNALRDVAKAVGADATAATLYPFVVDGLMALALVATLVLTDRSDKRFALRVLAAYTLASLVLNYVHGLVPELHGESVDWGRLADWDPANWALVLLATSLPVGSIYFGSDLVAKVLHHRPALVANQDETALVTVNQSPSELRESTPDATAPVVERIAPDSTDPAPSAAPVESAPVKELPGVDRPQRRATGRVPDAARSSRPTRTADELLAEARSVTADWPDAELTAEAIRKELRTAPAKARVLRDTLRAERAGHDTSESGAVAA